VCVVAKNITLALDERLIERARDYAHSHDLTLNGLVRKLLVEAIDPGDSGGPDVTFRLMDEASPKPSESGWRREDVYSGRLK
jgi:hypothetical protein